MLARSPSCVGANFALIRVYRMIGTFHFGQLGSCLDLRAHATGAPNLIAKPLNDLKIQEIQLDTLLHVFSERYGSDVRSGQLDAVFEEIIERALSMYAKTSISVSPMTIRPSN